MKKMIFFLSILVMVIGMQSCNNADEPNNCGF